MPRRFFYCHLFAIFLIAGCASPAKLIHQYDPETRAWTGRLAVNIDGVKDTPAQYFSASFDLIGQANAGELILYGPLGSTAAHLNWTPDAATLRSNGTVRNFNSLRDLALQATGTDLPIAALFDWLSGKNVTVPGWQADLTQLSQNRLTARRDYPQPSAELRLVIEP